MKILSRSLMAKNYSHFKSALLIVFLLTGYAFNASAQKTYCTPAYDVFCSSFTCDANLISLDLTGYGSSTLSDANPCGATAQGYSDETSLISAVDLQQGGSFSGDMSFNFTGMSVAIWIDFNDDTVFDASEQVTPVYLSDPTFPSTLSYTINIPLTAKTGTHRMRMAAYNTGSVATSMDPCNGYVIFSFSEIPCEGDVRDYNVNIVAAPPCTGTPVVTISPSGTVFSCAGGFQILNGSVPIASGYKFQWQTFSGGKWVATGAKDTTISDTIAVSGSTQYRLATICTNSGDTGFSNVATLTTGTPTYSPLPYFQDFENWQNYCATSLASSNDVPDGFWVNHPSYGDSSWRRDDQGATAGWSSTSSCLPWPSNSISGNHSARFLASSSPSFGCGFLPTGSGSDFFGNLDLYLDCSGPGDKELYFYFVSPPNTSTPFAEFNTDSLKVLLSTDGGATFTQVWGRDTASDWTRVAVPIVSNSPTTIIRFVGQRLVTPPPGSTFTEQESDIGLDSVYVAPPCSGTPTAGSINLSGPVTACPGQTFSLATIGTNLAGNLTYQWKQSTDGGITWTKALGSGDTTLFFNTPPTFSSILYEMVVSCSLSGPAAVDSTVSLEIDVTTPPTYATIPYTQSFENWMSNCSTNDIPDTNWANAPSFGNNSWRREDDGSDAGWDFPILPSPPSVDGNHSASIQTNEAFTNYTGAPGNLYMFINCSGGAPGKKELQFYLNNPGSPFDPQDSFDVYLSTDNGGTFSLIGNYGATTDWQFESIDFTSSSAQTVVLFQAQYESEFSDINNMSLDLVKVLPPCQGEPIAGTINNVNPCSGANFKLALTGTSMSAGLSYSWQESSGGTIWSTIAKDTLPIVTENITANTYFRAIVTCTNSGIADTSASRLIKVAPFYTCYCDPTVSPGSLNTFGPESSVGNFSILKVPSEDTVLDDGNPLPLESNFNPRTSVFYVRYDTVVNDISTIPVLYRDSVYQLYVTINSMEDDFEFVPQGSPVNIYIDMNQNGQYDPNELVLDQRLPNLSCCFIIPSLADATVADTFRVPDTATVGITGLRVMSGEGQSDPISPCGQSFYENQEIDYLVNINYRPCNGAVNAGTAEVTDSTMCVGYGFTLTDTSHEYKQSNIVWNWQTSPDDVSWGDIAGTSMSDTVSILYSVPAWYRLRMICNGSHDTTYSNIVKVVTGPPYACYCYSMATGGVKNDSSDIGAFVIGKYVFSKGGPHLLNPIATSSRTDHTGDIIDLYADSTYPVSVYQILKSVSHADARITLFMDFNNNFAYDIPDERVWTAFTSASDWYINSSITIPHDVITEVPTGMRLILNDNTAPNIPSDDACGGYTSGETNDFTVKFHYGPVPAEVGNIGNVQNLTVYPNPTTGKFTVEFIANNIVKDLKITVSNITGQQVLQRSYNNTNGQFSTQLDMSDQPRGVYFIEFAADGEKMIQKLIVK